MVQERLCIQGQGHGIHEVWIQGHELHELSMGTGSQLMVGLVSVT